MTSLHELINNLRILWIHNLVKAGKSLEKTSVNQMDKWEDLREYLSHLLSALYSEMIEFEAWLEQGTRKRSKVGEALIKDLKKIITLILTLQKEVLATGTDFDPPKLFIPIQQRFLLKITGLCKALQIYVGDLEWHEQKFLSVLALFKEVDGFILEAPVLIEKIRLEIRALEKDTFLSRTFLSQRGKIVVSLEDLSQQVRSQYELLSRLIDIPDSERILAALLSLWNDLVELADIARKDNLRAWREDRSSFNLFINNNLRDLEGMLRTVSGLAKDLEEVQKQLASW